jgi:hypothetical protein
MRGSWGSIIGVEYVIPIPGTVFSNVLDVRIKGHTGYMDTRAFLTEEWPISRSIAFFPPSLFARSPVEYK